MTEVQIRLNRICDYVHYAETGRITEAEAVHAIEGLTAAAKRLMVLERTSVRR